MRAKNDWLWQPPRETLEAITSVLGAHWAAAKSQQAQLFLPTSSWLHQSSWLRQPLGKLSWLSELTQLPWRGETPWRSRVATTERAAADSSDTLPDLHPC